MSQYLIIIKAIGKSIVLKGYQRRKIRGDVLAVKKQNKYHKILIIKKKLCDIFQLNCLTEVNGDKLGNTSFAHGNTKKPVNSCHCHSMMCND